MSGLPVGWAFSNLNDLVGAEGLFSDGDWIESKDQDPDGENRLLQLADIGDGVFINKSSRFVNNEKFKSLNCTELHAGDVLIARMPDPLGRACLMPEISQRCLTVVDVAVFRANMPGVSHKLIMHFLNSPNIRKTIELQSSGTTRKRIARGRLAEINLPIPPAAEQTRIADKLDELLAQVDTLKARIDGIPALLKRFRQSVLAAAVSGRLTEEWRIKEPREPDDASALLSLTKEKKLNWAALNSHHNEASRVIKRANAFDVSSLDDTGLPAGWIWSDLEDVVLLVVDCHNKTAPYQESGVPLVRTTNIRSGAFSWHGLRYVSDETYQFWSRRCPPEPGDIVFTREAPIGEAAIVPKGMTLCLGQRTMLFRCFEDLTSARYLHLALLDPVFKDRSEKVAVGTGVKHFRVGDVSNLKIPVPPKKEQTEIVRRVEQLFSFADQLEARVKTAQTRIDQLTQSILAKAFLGELVPQDPNEEPASVLLERIEAQRTAAPKAKRARKASA